MTNEEPVHVSIKPLVPWMFLIMFLILGAGLFTLKYAVSGANNSDQVKQGNQISACRSAAHVGIDDANAAVSRANSDQGIASSRLTQLTSTGLAASVAKDTPALLIAVAQLPAANAAIDQADGEVDQSQTGLKAATDLYKTQVALSLHDPIAFLHKCGAPAD